MFGSAKRKQQSRFDSYSVRNIISHITFQDRRVYIFPTTFLEIAVYVNEIYLVTYAMNAYFLTLECKQLKNLFS